MLQSLTSAASCEIFTVSTATRAGIQSSQVFETYETKCHKLETATTTEATTNKPEASRTNAEPDPANLGCQLCRSKQQTQRETKASTR